MTTIIAALFDRVSTAHSALYALVQHGVDRQDVQLYRQQTDEDEVNYVKEGYVADTGFDTLARADTMNNDHEEIREHAPENRWTNAAFSDEEEQFYREGIRRGGTVLIAQVDDRRADEIRILLEQQNAVDMAVQIASWRKEGWEGFDPNASPYAQEHLHDANSTVSRPPLSEDRR